MKDLMYADKEVEKIIKDAYPAAVLTDASDFIHEDRFEVEIPDVSEEDYFKFILREGLGSVSFGLQVMIGMKETQRKVRKWLDEVKAEV